VLGLDTGCAFGGRLSALCWPEAEIVQVPARAAELDAAACHAQRTIAPSLPSR